MNLAIPLEIATSLSLLAMTLCVDVIEGMEGQPGVIASEREAIFTLLARMLN